MFKNILRLLAACISFVALLFITRPAIATTTVTTAYTSQSPAVNLNVVSPSLQVAGNTDTLVNHVGCTCAACTQVLR